MSAQAVDRMPLATPARITQATAVEQSRAVAEVQAAVIVAQQCPRNEQTARAQMHESCKSMGLAERAFYSVPNRGNGPSVHLARELARIWGNLQYGVHELSRDDAAGMSEVQAFAWDVQTNTRSTRTFQVPHERMNRKERSKLTDLGDIYLNNQNQGARAVREAIFSILPPWFVEEAKEACSATLRGGGGKPLTVRISDAIAAFGGIGVDQDRIEARLGKSSAKWTEHDVAQLSVMFRTIERREVDADDEFPRLAAAGVTAEDVQAQAKRARAAKPAEAAPVADEPDPTLDPAWGGDS